MKQQFFIGASIGCAHTFVKLIFTFHTV